jgi:hypothetical protein
MNPLARTAMVAAALAAAFAVAPNLSGIAFAQNPSPQGQYNCWGCVPFNNPPFSHGWRCSSAQPSGYSQCVDWEESPGWWSCAAWGPECGNVAIDSAVELVAAGDAVGLSALGAVELAPGAFLLQTCSSTDSVLLIAQPGGVSLLFNGR